MAFFFTTPNKTSMPNAEYRFRLCPVAHNENNANGTASGKASRIVKGLLMLSNSEARIMYMKTTERVNARRNSPKVRSSSLARPVTITE